MALQKDSLIGDVSNQLYMPTRSLESKIQRAEAEIFRGFDESIEAEKLRKN